MVLHTGTYEVSDTSQRTRISGVNKQGEAQPRPRCRFMETPYHIKDRTRGTSLAVQGLRIHLPTQGTQALSLVWEDPKCHGANKPVATTTEARPPETMLHKTEASTPRHTAPLLPHWRKPSTASASTSGQRRRNTSPKPPTTTMQKSPTKMHGQP